MDPSVLTVYKCPFTKLRLGKDYDGGYIIAEIPNVNYTIFLAGGINDDISFEEGFIDKYPNIQTFAFDGTINNLPKENSNITFIKKNIGFENNEHVTNIHDIIDVNECIFVKMDIEGGEIPWIKSLSDDQMNKFEQIVMEFHNPFTDAEIDVFDKINKNHYLIHFHGNNCCGVRNHNGVIIPNVFECTYLHKKYFTNVPELNKDLIPSILDMKNTSNDEIYINHPPFVN
uniref:Methyltransferase FkbM domain-containing protein n=1 Tax=viral metagenome TaxID=1070528 RepID=A0A6C0HB99_9ZZZZ